MKKRCAYRWRTTTTTPYHNKIKLQLAYNIHFSIHHVTFCLYTLSALNYRLQTLHWTIVPKFWVKKVLKLFNDAMVSLVFVTHEKYMLIFPLKQNYRNWLIDWLVFNANFSSISDISLRKQMLYCIIVPIAPIIRYLLMSYNQIPGNDQYH